MTLPTILAHVLTDTTALPVPPAVLATAMVLVLLGVWRVPLPAAPQRRGKTAVPAPDEQPEPARLRGLQLVTRTLGLGLFMLALTAALVGDDRELANLAPPLFVGAGWPLLVLTSVLVGDVWRWVDPLDTAARLLGAPAGAAREDVRPAVPVALGWVAYLVLYPFPLAPRTLGVVVGTYALLVLAGCMVLGRRRVLSSVEAIGVLLHLCARGRHGLGAPPRGASALLGVVLGGLLFGLLRTSRIWGGFGGAGWWAAVAFTVSCAAGTALLTGLRPPARSVSPGSAAPGAGRRELPPVAVAAPLVGGVVLAWSLVRHRLLTSVQLAVVRLADPFGTGFEGLSVDLPLGPRSLGTTGLALLQCAAVLIGGVGAVLLTRRLAPGLRARQGLAVAAACTVAAAAALPLAAG